MGQILVYDAIDTDRIGKEWWSCDALDCDNIVDTDDIMSDVWSFGFLIGETQTRGRRAPYFACCDRHYAHDYQQEYLTVFLERERELGYGSN